jgi:hypothetical protein
MKQLFTYLILITAIAVVNQPINAQLFQQDFTSALTAGNQGGGTKIVYTGITNDIIYVNSAASTSQFTFLSTNGDGASIEMNGDGYMRLSRSASTIYVVRNTNFTGSPAAIMLSFDFNAETTSGTSGQTIQFMLGQNFLNSNNEPSAANKHSLFFINTKSPTGAPGTWGVTPLNASSESAYNSSQKVTWVINKGIENLTYTAPDGSTESLATNTYDLWVGTNKHYNDQAATTPDAELLNFEIRIAGGNGTYTIDNLIISEISNSPVESDVTDHFRTKQSGNWNEASTWESSPNGSTWVDATVTPYDISNTISIRNGHTVNVTADVTVDQVTIDEGGVLIVEGSPVVFTIADGPDDVDMVVSGTIKVTGTANASPGPYSVNLQGVMHFESTALYDHNQNGGSLPVSVWKPGSTITFTALTNTAPGNRSQNYSNIIFNSPLQTATFNLGLVDAVISGDIIINSTGTGRWQLCAPAAGASAYIDILGSIIQTAGNFTSHGSSNGTTTIVIHTRGNVTATGGNFSVSRGSQGGTGTTTWYIHGNLSMRDTETQNSNSAGAKFVFTGPGVHELNLNDVTFTGGLPIQVDSTVMYTGSVLKGSGIFNLSPTSSLICSNPGGLDSTFQNTGTLTLSQEANYAYNSNAPQITGIKLPSIVNKLEVYNLSGLTLSGDVEITERVTLFDGDINLNGKVLSLGSTGMLDERDSYAVKGVEGKITAVRTLNAPSSLNVAGMGAEISSAGDMGVTTVERYHAAATGSGNQSILRVFNISPSNNDLNASLKFRYKESELNGLTEADLRLFSSPNGLNNSWSLRSGSVNPEQNYVELSGINSFGYWTIADVNYPIPVELTSFSASTDDYAVILKWTTATENQNKGWEIERKLKTEKTWDRISFVDGQGTTTKPSSYQFRDDQVLEGLYQYRLKQLDYNGEYSYSDVVEIEINNMPSAFTLHQNYPNPFNPETVIRFELPEDSFINLSVYNVIGEHITTLVSGKMEKGRYSQSFNASDLPTGIYVYRLATEQSVITRKMILVK